MSFGYSVGDLLKLLELANELRRRFVDAPEQFQAISSEVRGLTIVLEDVKVLLPKRDLSSIQRQQLVDILAGCLSLLNKLKSKLEEYPELDVDQPEDFSIGQRFRQARKRLKWEPKDIEELRSRLSSNVNLLNTMYTQLNYLESRQIRETTSDIHDRQVAQAQTDQHKAILQWLTPIEYSSQHSDFSSRRQKGTGEWLLNSKTFQKWLANPRQTMFCPGIPGAGKTIMASAVINHLFEKCDDPANVGIAYVYGNFRRQGDQKPIDILSSLLRQFLQHQRSLPKEVYDNYENSKRRGVRPSIEELSRLFVSVLSHYKRSFIVIDALDECRAQDPACRGLLTALFDVQGQSSMNVLVTSRFIPEIMEHFKDRPGSDKMCIEAKGDDVRRYLEGHASRLPTFVAKNPDLQHEIVVEISQSIDGMFLLAQLHLDSLMGKRSPKAVRQALQALRKDSQVQGRNSEQIIDVAYVQAMERIGGQIGDQSLLGKQVLTWISCAKRPLTPVELQHALAIELETQQFDQDNLPEIEDMISVCAGLVTIDDASNMIRLVHYTTQEFFERTWTRWFPDAPAYITNLCLTSLSYDVAIGDIPNPCLFVDYAAENWGHHARGGHGDQELILNFLQDDSKRIRSGTKCSLLELSDCGALHMSSVFGLSDIAKELIRRGHDADGTQGSSMSPLALAAQHGYIEVVDVLLEAGAIADLDCQALWLAVVHGHGPVVLRLLKEPVDVNCSKHSNLPLWEAVSKGHTMVVRHLLAHPDIKTDIRDSRYGGTPFWEAVSNGHVDVAQLLLTTGNIDVNSRDPHYGRTPLLFAARDGNIELVRLLLANDLVDLNTTDRFYGTTPLWWAAGNGHEAVVRMLLEKKGIDVNAKDKYYQRTPLWEAVANSHIPVVKLLVANPRVDLNSRPSYL